MIEQSLLKSNFIGRDGFRWWVGQIPKIDSWSEQASGKGWGIRYKVRIMGYHPYDENILSDDDLPWAGTLLPVTAGSGGANFSSSSKVRPGDVVIGFFLDGDDAQIPMIMGTFGRTNQITYSDDGSPFTPFSGYTKEIPKKATTVLSSGENVGQGADGQKTALGLSSKQVKEKNSRTGEESSQEHSLIGEDISLANTCEDNFASNLLGVIDNLLNVIDESSNFFSDIEGATKKILALARGFVSNMLSNLYEKIVPILVEGMQNLFNDVFSDTLKALGDTPGASELAEAAGLDAQEAFLKPVKDLQDNFSCVVSKVVDGLKDTIQDMLESTILETVNFGVCTLEQALGGFINNIVDKIESAIEPLFSALDPIMNNVFKVGDFLRSGSDVIKSVNNFLQCGQKELCPSINVWTIGYGPKNREHMNKVLDNAIDQANNLVNNLLPNLESSSSYTKPDCGTPSTCGSPTVSFFGGSGSGGFGKAVLGSFINNTSGLSDVTSSVSRTASIVGVKITDPGSGYGSAPPIISFNDPCNRGYGAIARTIVDYDRNSPTYGQITGAYIISSGENYPVEDDEDNNMVIDTHILNQGSGYENGDTAEDDNGTEYGLTISNGRIISAKPINTVKVDGLPLISVNTSTGTGAIIKPLLDKYDPQGEVISVVDCVT